MSESYTNKSNMSSSESPNARTASLSLSDSELSESVRDSHGTYLAHLNLGDEGSPRDMLLPCNDTATITSSILEKKISSLQIHDFAFNLRSTESSHMP